MQTQQPASLTESSAIKRLSQTEAQSMITRYYNEINSKISSNGSIDDLFTWGLPPAEEKLLAFACPVIELGVFGSLVGVSNIVFSFGLEATQPADRPRFTVLIKGQNATGTIQSDYYQLLEAVPLTAGLPSYQAPPVSSSLSVPKFLFEAWTKGWEQLPFKYAQLCSIDIVNAGVTSKVPLQKYVFNVQDAINTLYPPELTIEESYTAKLYVCMVNHFSTNPNGSALLAPGKIGLIMGVAKEDSFPGAYTFISSCYDFSAPCPPTCP